MWPTAEVIACWYVRDLFCVFDVVLAVSYLCFSDICSMQVLSNNGDLVRQFGESGSAIRRFAYPVGLALDAADNIIIADQMNHRLQIFKQNGYFANTFGSKGEGDCQLYCPHGVCVDSDGRIVVCDANLVVRMFGMSATGEVTPERGF